MQSKIMILLLLFVFVSAFAQQTISKSDTAKIFRELEEVKRTKQALIAGLDSISNKIIKDTVEPEVHNTKPYKTEYDVYRLDGRLVTWVFSYNIKWNKYVNSYDTVFTHVTKRYAYWK